MTWVPRLTLTDRAVPLGVAGAGAAGGAETQEEHLFRRDDPGRGAFLFCAFAFFSEEIQFRRGHHLKIAWIAAE